MLSFVIFAACIAVASASDSEDPPTMFRIALAGNDGHGNSDSMAIQWSSKSNETASGCHYGLAADKLDGIATGTQAAYFTVAPQGRYHHTVILPSLKPATTYHYACSGSAVRSFVTPPRSVYYFWGRGYTDWTHESVPSKRQVGVVYSLTFRPKRVPP